MGTHAEKDYLLRASAWYDEVFFNANLVEGTAGATALLGLELARRGKGFTIDPVTYAFALDPAHLMSKGKNRTTPRKTFLRLARQYGLIDEDALQLPRLTPNYFSDDDRLRRFVNRVLTYQRSRCGEALVADKEFLSDQDPNLHPHRMLAPYFFMSHNDPWMDVNRRLAEAACEIAKSEFHENVYAVICIDSLILDQPEAIEKVAEMCMGLDCEGFCLWVADFNEQRATIGQIKGLADLASRVTQGGKPLLDLYGGYFAALLRNRGMSGISHGVGYGEKRDLIPVVGGGLPPAKYYLQRIHDEIYIDDLARLAQGLSRNEFVSEICRCTICQGLLDAGDVDGLLDRYGQTVVRTSAKTDREFSTPEVYRLSRYHFLHNRHIELLELRNQPEPPVSQLSDAYAYMGEKLGSSRFRFLEIWASALS